MRINLTDKEVARYLTEMGMYKVFNDLMFPPLPFDKDEEPINEVLERFYDKLLEEFNKSYPVEMSAIAVKKKYKFFFKDFKEFVSKFEKYFERTLAAFCLTETAKHPKWTKEQVSTAVSKKAEQIFKQSLQFVYNDVMFNIKERKILCGEQPFDF